MKLLPLTQGKFAKVDDIDFSRLEKYRWCAAWDPRGRTFYAKRTVYLVDIGGHRRFPTIKLHREILGVTDPKILVDHRNHDTLDCQRHNLRPCTSSQNQANRRGAAGDTISGVRGVGFDKRSEKWYAKLLSTLSWPRYFLDFETDNPVLPPYDGLHPYQQMPFQASLRFQKEPGAPVLHFEFVDDGRQDPRQLLVEFLADNIRNAGNIVAYHKSFEGGRLTELGSWLDSNGASGGRMVDLAKRLWDLADPFRQGLYVHPDFRGSWSIKSVLPVLVPDLSYDGLAIRDGAAAMAAYKRLRSPGLADAERAQIVADLKAYCGLDTQAMVRILEHLESVVAMPEAKPA